MLCRSICVISTLSSDYITDLNRVHHLLITILLYITYDWEKQLRIKQEMVNDEMRTKSSVLAITEIDFVQENQKMIDAINKY